MTGGEAKAILMDETGMKRALMRISHEILERNNGTEGLVIVGIRRRGAELAKRIASDIEAIEGIKIPCADIDIRYYRDDCYYRDDKSPNDAAASEDKDGEGTLPVVGEGSLDFEVEGKNVILVDDVFYTGRTARAAIEAIFSLGRPKTIRLAILIDRGHRELPIRADYVGKSVPTAKSEIVKVMIPPYDEETAAMLLDK